MEKEKHKKHQSDRIVLQTNVCIRPGIAFVPMRLSQSVVVAVMWEQIRAACLVDLTCGSVRK